MATILNILSSNYLAAGMNVASTSKYVDVDPKKFQGSWTGKYSDNASFSFQISNVSGYKATVKYQSGSTIKYQDVLIRDNSFRIGDSKFTLARSGVAQVRTVVTSPVNGSNTLTTAYAQQQT